jgi:cobalt-zinc-cadmium efflux system outer membrane protein
VQRQSTLQLSQVVELGGKRLGRLRIAAGERELGQWDLEAARIDALTNATHAFIDVLVAQELVRLTTQTGELVAQVEQSVGARVVAGVVSPIEETRAQVSSASARVERTRAERALATSRARLAGFWGRTSATFAGASGVLDTVSDVPTLDALRERLRQNPELARWGAEIVLRRDAVALEKAKRIPDVSLVGGYRRFPDISTGAYVAGLSIPLPLFDQNTGGVSETKSRLSRAYEEQRAAEARVAAALVEAHSALASAHNEVLELRRTVVPGSRQTFEAVSEGYRLGRFGFLDVLDAQRTMIAGGTQYLRALADYHKAVADVERLIGAPLNDRR